MEHIRKRWEVFDAVPFFNELKLLIVAKNLVIHFHGNGPRPTYNSTYYSSCHHGNHQSNKKPH